MVTLADPINRPIFVSLLMGLVPGALLSEPTARILDKDEVTSLGMSFV